MSTRFFYQFILQECSFIWWQLDFVVIITDLQIRNFVLEIFFMWGEFSALFDSFQTQLALYCLGEAMLIKCY